MWSAIVELTVDLFTEVGFVVAVGEVPSRRCGFSADDEHAVGAALCDRLRMFGDQRLRRLPADDLDENSLGR